MTNILERVERLIGGVVERPVERLFGRKLHPVHLARRLEEEMADAVLVSANGPVAPAFFVVWLDPATYQRFAGARAGIERDLEQHLTTAAAERDLRYMQSPDVQLQVDPELEPGKFEVETAFARGEGESTEQTRSLPESTMAMPVVPTVPFVEVRTRDGAVRMVWLSRSVCTIGRGSSNDLVLADPAVSRKHAVLRWDGARLQIDDVGSSNGLMVNGRRAESATLENGDSIAIGNCELVVRRV
jgi:predicted component of type VI protein secretion system